jgi:hypothetical protein
MSIIGLRSTCPMTRFGPAGEAGRQAVGTNGLARAGPCSAARVALDDRSRSERQTGATL